MTDPTQEHESSAEGAAATARRGAIQSGDNPRIVEEKLVAFLSRKDRASYRPTQGGGADLDLLAG